MPLPIESRGPNGQKLYQLTEDDVKLLQDDHDWIKTFFITGDGVFCHNSPRKCTTSILQRRNSPVVLNSPAQTVVLVRVNGIEKGGGRYGGAILTGNSAGKTDTNFQLAPAPAPDTPIQTETDGPTVPLDSSGNPANNALIVNVREPYVSNLHMLMPAQGYSMYCLGRVMGATNETPSRTIVYVDEWPYVPAFAQITGTFDSENSAGIYYGKLVQGQFNTNDNDGYESGFKNWASQFVTTKETCWISNVWEQNIATPGVGGAGTTHLLPIGTIVPGTLTGYPAGAALSRRIRLGRICTVGIQCSARP